jgi:hypothetical protein
MFNIIKKGRYIMAYQSSDYCGDEEFFIDCKGDCVVGDEIRFERATFTGSYRSAKFAGFEQITGEIIKESYGNEKQQHTFTIELKNGSKICIKGRNLYKQGVWRKKWENEDERYDAQEEKHERGNEARKARDERMFNMC